MALLGKSVKEDHSSSWFCYLTLQQILVQSDVLEVAQDMRDQLDEEAKVLQHVDTADTEDGWLVPNPMGIRTEREIHAELEGARIYRRLYQKLQLTS